MRHTPHAYLDPQLGSGVMVFDLGAPDLNFDPAKWAELGEEVRNHLDGIADIDGTMTDDGTPWVVLRIKPEPAGFAASLPEHEGW